MWCSKGRNITMDNKAKELADKINRATRLGQIARIFSEIEESTELTNLEKMNLNYLIKMKSERGFDKPLFEEETKEAEPPKKTAHNKECDELYSLLFVANEGHFHTVVSRDPEKFMDRVIKCINDIPDWMKDMIENWDDLRHYMPRFSLDDDMYWATDHMPIMKGDIEKSIAEVEENIIETVRGGINWGYFDLLRRTIHGIQLIYDNEEEIKKIVMEAKRKQAAGENK